MSRGSGPGFGNLNVTGSNRGTAGLENYAFYRQWARGNPSTAPSGVLGAGNVRGPQGQPLGDRGQYIGSYMKSGVNEEVLDLGGATSVTSTNNLLPANAIIEYVVTTPVVELTTPTTYSVGDTTTATRFGTSNTNDGSSGNAGPAYNSSHLTGTVAFRQTVAAKVKILPIVAGRGKIHVAVYYRQFVGGQA